MNPPPKPPWPGSEEPRTVFRPAPGADGPDPLAARTRIELPRQPPSPDRPAWMVEVLSQPRQTPAPDPVPPPKRGRWLAAALLGGAAAAVGAGLAYFRSDRPEAPPPPQAAVAPSPEPSVEVDPVVTAQQALAAGLQAVPCAWLDVASLQPGAGGVALAVRGVAGNPGDAQQEINRLLASRGVQAQTIDFEAVAPIKASECGPIDAFAAIRAPQPPRLTVAQRKFEMRILPADVDDAGTLSAPAIVEFDLKGLTGDATLLGLDDTGAMAQVIPGRDEARALSQEGDAQFKELSPDRYRFQLETSHQGWSGLVLLTGSGPFPPALLAGGAGTHDRTWQARFLDQARRQGWKAEMVWYKTVDDVPDATPSPGP
jgi:eukaryotic-like serine/threonine-protein kinase